MKIHLLPAAATAALALGLAAAPHHGRADESSNAHAHYNWNHDAVIGRSTLHRSADGLKATLRINANATDADRVLTLWFIVFNTPEGCNSSPCTPADLMNPAATADFLYGGGIVTTDNKAEFGGSLATGDNSGSGFIELGFPAFVAPGLIEPFGAEVLLALHHHGPAGSGAFLSDQISSYRGGCFELLGDPLGFAMGLQDVPDEVGECSTVIVSLHQP